MVELWNFKNEVIRTDLLDDRILDLSKLWGSEVMILQGSK